MKTVRILSAAALLLILLSFTLPAGSSPTKAEPSKPETETSAFEATGRVGCKQNAKGIIAPVPLHPVVEVLVAQGDRVKKGQILVKLDDDEQQAEVKAKQAAYENAQTNLEEAKRHHGASENNAAALPEIFMHTARVNRVKAEREERAAQAALESAKAELEHFTITAPIDGVISWLDVHPGMVSRPGTTVWGEILDLTEVDVRCELTPEQVDSIAVGQAAQVRKNKKQEVFGTGRINFIGCAADKVTGLIPVTVRVVNPNGCLRCETPVQVRFVEASAK